MERQTILMIDDDPEMRLALTIRLRASGYEVAAAVDGVSAIAEARRQQPSLILLDLGLPAGNGFTVLERLQAIEPLGRIPVIVLSGRSRADNQERALKAGARLFLQKPVKNADLLSSIAELLHPKAQSASVVYELNHRQACRVPSYGVGAPSVLLASARSFPASRVLASLPALGIHL